MRDILVLIVVALTIPLSFYRPFYGLIGFSWLAYMRPQDLAWGLAASLPLSKALALCIWASLILRGKVQIFRVAPVTLAMLGLWLWLLVTAATAQHTDVAWVKFTEISKVFLVSLLTVVLVTDEKRFKTSMAVIGFSLGVLGLKFGLFGVLRGGVHFTKGVGGMIGDNNDFALALNMTLPILTFLAIHLDRRWLRWAAACLIPMCAMTIIFTHSRGGFLTLVSVTLYLIAVSKRSLLSLLVVLVIGAIGYQFVPKSFFERIQTITNFQEDGSATGRLNAWQTAFYMANDYPIVGVGLDNFTLLFTEYAPDPERVKVAHNTYLQVLAEAGYTGLMFYLLLVCVSLWTFAMAVKRARRMRLPWAVGGATYLAGSLMAFLVGALFLNRAHFDLTYHVMVLGCCVLRVVDIERQVQEHERQMLDTVAHAA